MTDDQFEEKVILQSAKELMADGAILREVKQAVNSWLLHYHLCIAQSPSHWIVGDFTDGKGEILTHHDAWSEALTAALEEAARRISIEANAKAADHA